MYLTPYVSLTNPASYLTCDCSLQSGGNTAMMLASLYGRTKIVLALLAAAGIDVNHADVSINPLIPSHVLVEVVVGEVYLPFPFPLTLVLMSYHPPTSKMYPSLGKKN